MRFSVETWSPEYGGGPDSGELPQSGAKVDVGVEVDPGSWAPIRPAAPAEQPEVIAFVDGVRRIDARVWIADGDLSRPGVCATVAAGVVECREGSAALTRSRVQHVLVAEAAGAGPILTAHATYELHPVPEATTEDLYLGIHERMTALETELSAEAGSGESGSQLVVFDGPLRGRNHPAGVGLVKTHHVHYLTDDLLPVISKLGEGERTPLLLLQQGPATRWSWYLRLPGPVAHAWSGVVRCELPALGTAEEAAARAELVSALLPTYASESHKDPRAPQNLYPIAGLERQLRQRLGDPALLERALRSAAAELAATAAGG